MAKISCGTIPFSELRRGMPRLLPSLLAERLKELEQAGVVRSAPGPSGVVKYISSSGGWPEPGRAAETPGYAQSRSLEAPCPARASAPGTQVASHNFRGPS